MNGSAFMSGLYLGSGLLLLTAMAMAVYWSIRSYRIYKTNLLVTAELDNIIASTLETLKENRAVVEESEIPNMMDSPELMSTIITVLITKFGDVRLDMQDFAIADKTQVSVYVDTDTQEIILSLNGTMAVDDVYVGFKNPNDNTFH